MLYQVLKTLQHLSKQPMNKSITPLGKINIFPYFYVLNQGTLPTLLAPLGYSNPIISSWEPNPQIFLWLILCHYTFFLAFHPQTNNRKAVIVNDGSKDQTNPIEEAGSESTTIDPSLSNRICLISLTHITKQPGTNKKLS